MRQLRSSALFTRLALAAILLLCIVPTLGRLAALPEAPPDPMSAMAHAHAMPAQQPAGDPVPAHAHVHDCPYCLLLAGTLPTASVMVSVAVFPAASPTWGRSTSATARSVRSGLGARGPPAVT